jgi:photosystem II stability/assembly factor-like uncharacterized protein
VGSFGKIKHWDGDRWSKVTSPSQSHLYSIAMTAPTDGWAVGSTLVLHWDGEAWRAVDTPAAKALWAVDMLSANEGWIVGAEGEILHYENSSCLYLPLVAR